MRKKTFELELKFITVINSDYISRLCLQFFLN